MAPKKINPKDAAAAFAAQVRNVTAPTSKSAGAKDMYANPSANTGWGSSSQANAGYYVPYRISLDYLQLLHIYRGSWIARAVVDTIPEDMLKSFPELILGEADPDDENDFNTVVAQTHTLQKLIEGLKWGRLFGGAIAIICLAGDNDLEQPLELENIEPDSYRGLIIVDRWSGCNPSSELNSSLDDPANYGLPMYYEVTTETNQTFRVHYSRVLRFTGRDLPLFEKQIQTYWGMSELEAVIEELKRRDFSAAGIADLISRAHVLVMKEPMLAQMLSGVNLSEQQYADYVMRMRAVSETISTNGIMAIGADGGENSEVYNMGYSFGGLADVYSAFMLDIAGACGIPVSRLYGRSVTGLGQTGEGDLQTYYDTIEQKRNRELRPLFDRLIPIICMSLWGEVPADLDYRFSAVRTMTPKEKAELGKQTADTLQVYVNLGAFGRKTLLNEIKASSDITGVGETIPQTMIDEADDEPMGMGMDGADGGEGGMGSDVQDPNKPGGDGDEKPPMPQFEARAGIRDAMVKAIALAAKRAGVGKFALGDSQSTEEKYGPTGNDGNWSDERKALHEEILNRLFDGRTSKGIPPTAYILGGGSASGKSTSWKKLKGEKFDQHVMKVDSDAIKDHIPEYADLKRIDPENAAARVHEESSYIAKRALNRSMAKGLDFVYDSTGSSEYIPHLAKLAKENGYNTEAHYFDVDTDTAMKRANSRGEKTGRVVPKDVIQKSHTGAASMFHRVKDSDAVDNATVYNTRDGVKPVYRRMKGEDGHVHDEQAWKDYAKKAGVTV